MKIEDLTDHWMLFTSSYEAGLRRAGLRSLRRAAGLEFSICGGSASGWRGVQPSVRCDVMAVRQGDGAGGGFAHDVCILCVVWFVQCSAPG